ncbi:unnamed protein product [Dibothriocephalus latus]|uniref:DM2 domain-containing protein n=1 Tax=Dibothriocephalus latus TaxID=60516 RepID=A0A3P7QQ23_DIBLA|nr:unnamed protein product [Dibothriocephalus latus]
MFLAFSKPRLQDSHEKDFINCDQYLEQVFGCQRMRFAEIPNRLAQLQHAPDPIVINHVIINEGEDPNKTSCYDIEVEVVCFSPLPSVVAHLINSDLLTYPVTARCTLYINPLKVDTTVCNMFRRTY